MELREGEPYFFIRGQDALAPAAIEAYAGLLEGAATALLLTADRGGEVPTEMQERILALQQGATDVRTFSANVAKWQNGAGRQYLKLPD